jgi:hypothetical protein
MRYVVATFRAVPFTIVFFAAFVTVGILTGGILKDQHASIRSYVGWDLETLEAARYWRQLPNTLVPTSPGIKWHEPLLLVMFVGGLEYRAGTLAAVSTFFFSDWISSPLTVLTVWGLSALGSSTAASVLHTASSGASAASLACGAALACLLPGRWSVLAAGVILGIVLHSFTYQALDTSIAHAYATVLGTLAGLLLWGRRPQKWRAFRLPRGRSNARGTGVRITP